MLFKKNELIFRSVPPSLILTLAMTEPEEKKERYDLMKQHNCSELEAAFLMAESIDNTRGMETLPWRHFLAMMSNKVKLNKTQWEELKVIILIFLKYMLLGTLYLWTTELLLSSLVDLLERNHIEDIDQFTFGVWLFVISYIIYALGTPFYIIYNFLIRMSSINFPFLNNRMIHMMTSNV